MDGKPEDTFPNLDTRLFSGARRSDIHFHERDQCQTRARLHVFTIYLRMNPEFGKYRREFPR